MFTKEQLQEISEKILKEIKEQEFHTDLLMSQEVDYSSLDDMYKYWFEYWYHLPLFQKGIGHTIEASVSNLMSNISSLWYKEQQDQIPF